MTITANPSEVSGEPDSGVVHVICGGVELYLDKEAENTYILVRPGFDREALKVIEILAHDEGYELMPHGECLPEDLPNGDTRHWLIERVGCE